VSVNKVILIGNAGKDPEIRSMGTGKEVASFNLATTDYWKDKTTGEKKDKTEWHNIVVFSPGLINIIKSYVKKGSKLYIEGALQTRKWVDNKGVEKRTTEVVLQGFNCTMQMLDNRQEPASAKNAQAEKPVSSKMETTEKSFVSEEIDDDIPF